MLLHSRIPLPFEETCSGAGNSGQLPPWARRPYVSATSGRGSRVFDALHEEIVDFCGYMGSAGEDDIRRARVVERARRACLEVWPNASVTVVGSTVTHLFLPVSDIDVVVHGYEGDQPLDILGVQLQNNHVCHESEIEVIEFAQVPIIKYFDREDGLRVDISFGVENSIRSAEFTNLWVSRIPCLRPLTLVLKSLLYHYRLNEPFTGGLGSYSLFVLLLWYLKHNFAETEGRADLCDSMFPDSAEVSEDEGSREKGAEVNRNLGAQCTSTEGGENPVVALTNAVKGRRASGNKPPRTNLGQILISFLNYFANHFNMKQSVISFDRKFTRKEIDEETLSIEDPCDPKNNLGRKAYNFLMIQLLFSNTLEDLTSSHRSRQSGDTLLKTLFFESRFQAWVNGLGQRQDYGQQQPRFGPPQSAMVVPTGTEEAAPSFVPGSRFGQRSYVHRPKHYKSQSAPEFLGRNAKDEEINSMHDSQAPAEEVVEPPAPITSAVAISRETAETASAADTETESGKQVIRTPSCPANVAHLTPADPLYHQLTSKGAGESAKGGQRTPGDGESDEGDGSPWPVGDWEEWEAKFSEDLRMSFVEDSIVFSDSDDSEEDFAFLPLDIKRVT